MSLKVYYDILFLFRQIYHIIYLMGINILQLTPDKSDSQVTGKSVRLSEMSDLSEINNITEIIHEMCRAS